MAELGKFVWDEFQDPERDYLLQGTFPNDFMWGVATAAYQIEGGWDTDGKGPCTWDTFSHIPGKIYKDQTADVACDSYHKFEEDVSIMKELGVTHYRFSLSWSRILPKGFPDEINQAGIDYYHKLLDALIAANITPVVTIHHFDLPQVIENLGGWENELTAVYFNMYADLCFREFGNKVKMWFTINEPKVLALFAFEMGIFPPGVNHMGYGLYRTVSIMLKAHAMAYRTYDAKYRDSQGGKVSIVLNSCWSEPKSDIEEDRKAAERMMQFELGLVANPIFKDGDYPEVVKEYVDMKSKAAGLLTSRLPQFTPEEKKLIAGTADFFAINHYSTKYIAEMKSAHPLLMPILTEELDVEITYNQSYPRGVSNSQCVAPWGLRRLLKWIKNTYGDMPVYVTENGFSESDGVINLEDTNRCKYYTSYINEVLKARNLDGVDVKGYFAWTLMDNFEWSAGYSERFGLYHVDFEDPERPRRAKKSVETYANIIKNKGFPA